MRNEPIFLLSKPSSSDLSFRICLLVRGLESLLVAYSLPPHTIKTSVYLALFLERDDGFLPYCLKSTKDVELPLTFDLGN